MCLFSAVFRCFLVHAAVDADVDVAVAAVVVAGGGC